MYAHPAPGGGHSHACRTLRGFRSEENARARLRRHADPLPAASQDDDAWPDPARHARARHAAWPALRAPGARENSREQRAPRQARMADYAGSGAVDERRRHCAVLDGTAPELPGPAGGLVPPALSARSAARFCPLRARPGLLLSSPAAQGTARGRGQYPPGPAGAAGSHRRDGARAAGGALGLVAGYLNEYASYDGAETFPTNGVTSPITPNSEHYVVTQNPIDPAPSLNAWRLEITGLVGTPATYTYEEFTALPSTSRAVTLECIANGVGGHLISTAIWQGVTFRSLLEKHGGTRPGAKYVAFYSVDGYTVSQPLDDVLEADALLAFRMNGEVLPMKHGYPLRVLIPGHYGEENPKWLTRIELTDHFVDGLYSDQGWYTGQLHTMTRIYRPFGRIRFQPTIEIVGIAFSGRRGIQRVEVSTDNGASWSDAQLAPPLSQDTWVLWTYQWHPAARGHYTLVARATDGTGQVQTSRWQSTVPNGGTGYPIIPMDLI